VVDAWSSFVEIRVFFANKCGRSPTAIAGIGILAASCVWPDRISVDAAEGWDLQAANNCSKNLVIRAHPGNRFNNSAISIARGDLVLISINDCLFFSGASPQNSASLDVSTRDMRPWFLYECRDNCATQPVDVDKIHVGYIVQRSGAVVAAGESLLPTMPSAERRAP